MGAINNLEQKQGFLRFIACGSVDDGKSTLIGRILFDADTVHDDKLESVKKESAKYGTTGTEIDLALLVDGLQSEREQGITIDVAHLYFSTKKKKYIIADTPGHEQYTANMATGASTADAAIILVDARKGILTQTKRHSFIAHLLGIKHLIIAVNKMDLVDFSQDVFEKIKADYVEAIGKPLGIENGIFIPISAVLGDNVVSKSAKTPWYEGDSIIDTLDALPEEDTKEAEFRLPVQYVNRPNLDFRGYCGTVASGEAKVNDEIIVLPSNRSTRIKSIFSADGETLCISKGEAATITTEDEIDITRGDIIVKASHSAKLADAFVADIIWFSQESCESSKSYSLKIAAKTVRAQIEEVLYIIDPNTLSQTSGGKNLELNDIASCRISLHEKIAFDSFEENKTTGAFILIDRLNNKTVAAGMIREQSKKESSSVNVGEFEKELNALIRKHFPQWECKEIV